MEGSEVATSPQSYYDMLNVAPSCSLPDIRRAYRTLARQWHPDKWANAPDFAGEAKLKFQNIQEAYSVLSDPTKRMLYDAGMYDPTYDDDDDDDHQIDEGLCDFMQEMWSLMSQVKHQEVGCSMEDLQTTLSDLLQGFDHPLPQSQCSTTPTPTPWACSANLHKQPLTNERPSHV